MGLIQTGLKEFIDVPLRIDTALDMTDEEYNEFIDAKCEKGKLTLKAAGVEPIYFRLRKVLPYHLNLKIENLKMEMVKRKEGDEVTNEMVPRMSFIAEEVRFSITDIINPADCPEDEKLVYKRDSDGVCSPEIMAFLMNANSHMDLWRARQTFKAGPTKEAVEKKK